MSKPTISTNVQYSDYQRNDTTNSSFLLPNSHINSWPVFSPVIPGRKGVSRFPTQFFLKYHCSYRRYPAAVCPAYPKELDTISVERPEGQWTVSQMRSLTAGSMAPPLLFVGGNFKVITPTETRGIIQTEYVKILWEWMKSCKSEALRTLFML